MGVHPADGGFGESKEQTSGEVSASSFSWGFPCSGRSSAGKSPSSEFEGSPGSGEVRTLNQHFKRALSAWHREELVQSRAPVMCVPGSSSLGQDPAWVLCFPGEPGAGRGRAGCAGMAVAWSPGLMQRSSSRSWVTAQLISDVSGGVLGEFYCVLCPPVCLGCIFAWGGG